MKSGFESRVGTSSEADAILEHLIEAAMTGLLQMFDHRSRLFCFRLKRTERGLVQQGISRRYTIITLLGLHRLEESGTPSLIAPKPLLEELLASLDWVDNIGDLGLLLWACALMMPERLSEIENLLQIEDALARYRDAREGRTMELSWFLSGLSHSALAQPEKRAKFRDLALETYRLIRSNQGVRGIFAHQARNRSILGRTRGWIGSFADQVYPIYAMTQFSEAYEDRTAVQAAMTCAHPLCQAQGPLGQWWWHYNSSSNRVVEAYPVFSVHQYGMAPMTLFALGEATQFDFSPWIYKGLEWISSRNELAFNMEDASVGVVWRCILRSKPKRVWDAVCLLTRGEDGESGNGLKVLCECRPYELGWLLYAFSKRKSLTMLTTLGTAQ